MVTGEIIDPKIMVYGHLSDTEMAVKVRMLMRDTLSHEAVCCGARDRIMYLSQELERERRGIAECRSHYENEQNQLMSKYQDLAHKYEQLSAKCTKVMDTYDKVMSEIGEETTVDKDRCWCGVEDCEAHRD